MGRRSERLRLPRQAGRQFAKEVFFSQGKKRAERKEKYFEHEVVSNVIIIIIIIIRSRNKKGTSKSAHKISLNKKKNPPILIRSHAVV